MKKKSMAGIVLLAVSLLMSAVPMARQAGAEAGPKQKAVANCISPAAVQLQGDLRRLWIEHAIWTRSYMVSALAGLEDQSDVLARLMRNQQDIGDAVKPFYGEAAGNKLAELLKTHIAIAGKIIDAAKNGRQDEAVKLNKEWYRNADEIAAFLSAANQNWPERVLKDMLYVHLQLLTENVTARLNKDWKADIAAFDKGEMHLIHLADILAAGIVKQFPMRFQ